jgi:hypothetical protein
MKIALRNKARKIKFAGGGKLDPPTEGNGTEPRRRIRVIGSAPLIEESQLGYQLDKYTSLLSGNQEEVLREIAGREEFGVEGSGTEIEFADQLRDFGIDPMTVRDQTFINEFERTQQGFYDNFSDVRFFPVHGPQELEKALANFSDDEDVAILDHFSGTRILGNKVGNEKNINIPLKSSELSHTLGKSIKSGTNCYLGICHGEDVANQLKNQGVNLNFFARPALDSYTGPNTANADKGFNEFFFGTSGDKSGATKNNNPILGKDFVNVKPRISVPTQRATQITDLATSFEEPPIDLEAINKF